MSGGDKPRRLASVDAVRAHQRAWLDETRARVDAGEHFAICNADDFEEVFTAFGIPALVINYWNAIVGHSAGQSGHFLDVLERHGYPREPFGIGLATALDPAAAPWGGLPRPTVIIGTTRDEAQMRVTELWAEAYGCPCLPLDFSWTSQFSRLVPPRWWEALVERGETVVDPARLDLRIAQLRDAIAQLEMLLGRTFDWSAFAGVMQGINRQMAVWAEAMDMIRAVRPLPVSLRDQMAMYQTMWQRGTPANIALVEAFRDEVRDTIARGERAHGAETSRAYLATSGNDPRWHAYLRERWGAAVVSNRYSGIAPLYARALGDDPLRALASRQLFLFDKEPYWEVHEALRWGADVLVVLEADGVPQSRYARVAAEAGLRLLALPEDADTPEVRARIDALYGAG